MSSAITNLPPPEPAAGFGELANCGVPRSASWRTLKNRIFLGICIAVTAISVLLLVVLLGSIVLQGTKYLTPSFFNNPPSRKPALAGFMPAIWGSVWVCFFCMVIALPMGVGTAIFLEEYKPRGGTLWGGLLKRGHSFVQLNIRNLAGVPSIVYGIIGLTCFVRMFGVFGSPNVAMYDSMRVLSLKSGESVQATLVEETDTAYSLMSPLKGPLTIAKSDVDSAREVYVHTHHFELADGREVEGKLRSMDGTLISIDPGARKANIEFKPSDVRAYASENAIRLGNPDTFFFLRLPLGGSVLAGALTLALVVLPTIIIAASEALRAVPNSLRQGAFALGCTRWQVVSKTVLPSALPGIMTGSILAVSRAIGEAAPLLVVGGFLFITFAPRNLMSDFAAMPLQIYNWAQRPQEEFHQVAASGILVLLSVLLVFNFVAILVRQLFQRKLS